MYRFDYVEQVYSISYDEIWILNIICKLILNLTIISNRKLNIFH